VHVTYLYTIITYSHAQTSPSSHEKGSGVTSPDPWASSTSMKQPIISHQHGLIQRQEQVLQSSIVLLNVML